MFSLTNLDTEVDRAVAVTLAQPQAFGLTITDEDLCQFYLYHLVVGNFGIFNETPILHLRPDDIPLVPLVPHLWGMQLEILFHGNRSLYIATDGEFDIPDTWAKVGRPCGPIFRDEQLHFYSTRYRLKTSRKDSAYLLDLLSASPAPNLTVAPAYNYNFRIMRIHNPHLYNYRGRNGRRKLSRRPSGPYGPPPSPFVGPRGFPPNYHGFILFDPALHDLL